MPTRFALGLVMMLTGLGLLTPPVWMLCSPFLSYAVESSGSQHQGFDSAVRFAGAVSLK